MLEKIICKWKGHRYQNPLIEYGGKNPDTVQCLRCKQQQPFSQYAIDRAIRAGDIQRRLNEHTDILERGK